MARSTRRPVRIAVGAVATSATALLFACAAEESSSDEAGVSVAAAAPAADTCRGIYPSFWQDPAAKFADQWQGQEISNVPPDGWSGPVFQLSDAYPTALPDESGDQPWRAAKFDALFDPATDQETKTRLADEYIWAVMRYAQEGNIDASADGGNVEDDWQVCSNRVRNWYHMPYQTYDVLSGREFTHGLTREAPVTFSLETAADPYASTMWAVGFFNPTAAWTLGQIWEADGTPAVPTSDVSFAEGAVVVKPLFNTLSDTEFPILANMPSWQANISEPTFCGCSENGGTCDMVEQSKQCPRSTTKYGPVRLLQFDIAVKDSRAPGTEWVYGTFVADGVRKAGEANPWNRISPLGLMWGNDQPPAGQLAANHPADPRSNGFEQEVIFWDAVDMLNAVGGSVAAQSPGHLGCNSRLDGPADNVNSACMSCHQTASVPDVNLKTPPIVTQFNQPLTQQCVTPDPNDPTQGTDAGGASASVTAGISFADIDSLWFASTPAATPFNTTVDLGGTPTNVLPGQPAYNDGRESWVSLDYSLQLSISLTQWGQWRQHQAEMEEQMTQLTSAGESAADPDALEALQAKVLDARDHVRLPRRNRLEGGGR